jgi:hypothetical protein
MRCRSAAKSHACGKKMVERRQCYPAASVPQRSEPWLSSTVCINTLEKHVCPGSFVLVTDQSPKIMMQKPAKSQSRQVTIVQAWLCPRLWSPFLAQRRFASVRSFTTFS